MFVSIPKTTPRASPYERAALAAVFKSDNRSITIEKIVSARWPKDVRTAALITKTDQTVGTTSVAGWAGEIATESWGQFMQSIEPYSAIAGIMDRGLVSPLGRATSKKLPLRTSAKAAMAWVAEGAPIPVREYVTDAVTLTPKRMAVISVISRELAKYSDAENIIGTIFREDSGFSLDSAYFSTDAVSAARHPGLLNGLTALTGYAGGGEAALREDLTALFSAVAAGGSGKVVLIASSTRALNFKAKFPQHAAQLEILGSAAVPEDRLIALDAQALIHGFGAEPSFDSSGETLLHMSDTPLEIVSGAGPTTSDPVMSAYQVGAIALRCELEIAFGKRRTNAVAFLDNPSW